MTAGAAGLLVLDLVDREIVPEADQAAAKTTGPEAHRGGGGSDLQLLTDDPHIRELVDCVVTSNRTRRPTGRDRRGDVARTAHNAFVAAADSLACSCLVSCAIKR